MYHNIIDYGKSEKLSITYDSPSTQGTISNHSSTVQTQVLQSSRNASTTNLMHVAAI